MNIFCKIFGHKTVKDNSEDGWLTGAIHCTRKGCDYKRLALKWPKPPRSGYQPLKDGEPCTHPGCLSHDSHPCEGCGRIAGMSGLGEPPKGDRMGKKESNSGPPVKKVTKKRLIEIFKIWKEFPEQSFEEIKKGWASPDYSKDCAEYVWSKL